jgi:elongation factor P--(R)-beta-lysine ligase
MSMEKTVLAAKRPNLELHCQVVQIIRSFFFEAGFLEVHTPVCTPAPAPELHIDAIPCTDGFLSTSPELYMKRLLAAGYEKIFQLGPAFRAGERGRLHHPEFMLLEWYRLGSDYTALQADCIELVQAICRRLGKGDGFHSQGKWLETRGGWQSLTVRDAFRHFAGWEPGSDADSDRFDMDLVEKVEPNLGDPTPTFLVDYPAGQAALARLKTDDPTVAERFELYWAGIELANGFSELVEAREQRRRFHETNENRRLAGRTVYPVAEAFLQSLQHLQPSAGIALGVDRLVLILADAADIGEVVAFPPEMA